MTAPDLALHLAARVPVLARCESAGVCFADVEGAVKAIEDLVNRPVPPLFLAFMGGTYRRDNVRPMCHPCNTSNQHTPSREWVIDFAATHGITLRKRRCPQYGAEWYRAHRLSHRETLTQTIAAAVSGETETLTTPGKDNA